VEGGHRLVREVRPRALELALARLDDRLRPGEAAVDRRAEVRELVADCGQLLRRERLPQLALDLVHLRPDLFDDAVEAGAVDDREVAVVTLERPLDGVDARDAGDLVRGGLRSSSRGGR